MPEHPIIFTGENVRAILTCAECGTITVEIKCPKCGSLERRKTQTRRIAKLPKEWHRGFRAFENNPNGAEEFVIHGDCGTETIYCPYGKVGDTLWVREAMGLCPGTVAIYKADGEQLPSPIEPTHQSWLDNYSRATVPSIRMPRWATRIFLEITGIRVERAQDIMGADCVREGCPPLHPTDRYKAADEAHEWFEKLWDSINAKRGYGWDKNPWVWSIEFKQYPKAKG